MSEPDDRIKRAAMALAWDVRRIVREELEAEAREVDQGLERAREASRGSVCLDPHCSVCHPERALGASK